MELVKKYGRQAAAVFSGLGLLSIVLAFTLFSQPTTAVIWHAGNETMQTVRADSPFPANWLLNSGIPLYPGDRILYGGVEIPPDFKLSEDHFEGIVFQPAYPIHLVLEGTEQTIYSAAATLGEALAENGIILFEGDEITPSPDTALSGKVDAAVKRGQDVNIQAGQENFSIQTAAGSVLEALAEAGLSLQELDYSIPGEDSPIPDNREIRVVRVREEVLLEDEAIPFTEERIADPDLAIGEQLLLQSGQNGQRTVRVRIRYENGEEISRTTETEWISRQPVSQKVAYGTTVVLQSGTGECPGEYWLEQQVRITSYRDTGNKTASGVWPYYGVIAVSPEWYSILKGSSICVPGYGIGTVLDVCPGCSGEPWIDVFIPTEDYVPWSKNLVVYFLPPVPDGFAGSLP